MAKKCKHEGCRYTAFSEGYCQGHQGDRVDQRYLDKQAKKKEKQRQKQEEHRKKALSKPRKQINKKSKRKQEEDAIYLSLLPAWKLANPVCAFPYCESETHHCHHSRGRLKYYLAVWTWVPLCSEHHSWVEEHPTAAKKLNLSASRLENIHGEKGN